MELKDWMLLFIPILFNGILIWGFQFKLKYDFERKETYRKLQEQIFNTYVEKISKSIESNRKVISAVVNKEEDDCLKENIYDLRDDIQNLIYYYEMYVVILSTNDNVVNEYKKLKTKSQEWMENWNNNNIQISFLNDCKKMLQCIMDECLKYIYGIKNYR